MSFSNFHFGPSHDESNDTLDDILQTVSSLSKISRNDQSLKLIKTNGYHRPQVSYNLPLDNSSTSEEYHPYQNAPSSSGPEIISRGRGKYMKTLAQKYANEENNALRDKMIHEQLQQINGSGYSNYDIEQRFGSPIDYSSDNWSTMTGKSTSSSFTSLEEKSTFETISDKNYSDQSSLVGNLTSSSKQADDSEESYAEEEIDVQQSLDGPSPEKLSGIKPDMFHPENMEGTSACPEKELSENGQFEDANLLEHKKADDKEIVVKNSPKKKKVRRCRNAVILSLTQKMNPQEVVPAVCSPPKHEDKKSWVLSSKDSIFCPEDFPSL